MQDPDTNGYIPPSASTFSPDYPKWMFHPTKPSQVVVDASSQAALMASDAQWTSTDTTPTT